MRFQEAKLTKDVKTLYLSKDVGRQLEKVAAERRNEPKRLYRADLEGAIQERRHRVAQKYQWKYWRAF
jgi:hypothetical protein